jgi:putative copper resistance protein D
LGGATAEVTRQRAVAAQSHRATALVSRSRALLELALMAVALTLAAALAVTG